MVVRNIHHHCKGTSWLPPTFGRLTSLQPTSWCPKVHSPPSEIRQGLIFGLIEGNQWLLISPDHKDEVAGSRLVMGFMDVFVGFVKLLRGLNAWLAWTDGGLPGSPFRKNTPCRVTAGTCLMEVWFRSCSFLFMGDGCRFQPSIFQGVIVLKHDIKKSQELLVERGTRPKSGNGSYLLKKNRSLIKTKFSHQDTDRNHVILTNLIGGFRFSHQNGTGGIILGGHHVHGAFPTDFPTRAATPYHCNLQGVCF